ncbi:MEKHLA domain-containing protein [Methyloprofundus sp.]|uniref:MEKHLA domain-containing protein n=1 Tax=Methyloprofundus sp. TaxID=2020875 RepID=UPI003D0A1961
MHSINKPGPDNHYLAEHVELLASSYLHWTGKDLLEYVRPCDNIYRALFEAPFGVVSHGTEVNPVFNYANQTALNVFQMEWLEFTTLPSQKSAEPVNQAERQQLLARVSQYGFIDDYRGERISSTGEHFMIEEATVWNIVDKKGTYYGQAAVFYQWSEL